MSDQSDGGRELAVAAAAEHVCSVCLPHCGEVEMFEMSG